MPADFGRYAKREYERRWLLRALPTALDPDRPWSRISDHYIDGTRFRVRQRVRTSDNDIAWKLTAEIPRGRPCPRSHRHHQRLPHAR
jgi:hypothetical protein